jgi:twitching motility two-component system response regulator PilH
MTKTILIAAQSPGTIYLLRRYAEESGYRVVQADQDGDMLPIVKQVQPAVVLLELETLNPVGWQILDQLTVDDATSVIPVIVCSWAEVELHDAPPALVERAAGYLQKPVLYNDFLAALGELGLA